MTLYKLLFKLGLRKYPTSYKKLFTEAADMYKNSIGVVTTLTDEVDKLIQECKHAENVPTTKELAKPKRSKHSKRKALKKNSVEGVK